MNAEKRHKARGSFTLKPQACPFCDSEVALLVYTPSNLVRIAVNVAVGLFLPAWLSCKRRCSSCKNTFDSSESGIVFLLLSIVFYAVVALFLQVYRGIF